MHNHSYGIFRDAKFIILLHKKYTEVKTVGETNKNIVPEVAGKTNAALKRRERIKSRLQKRNT
ncbi:MAG: hypothetical protein QG610_2518 [Euryarchaeota archaeon]|nr:hypothetical protein [Euryarchaeota archaeon]